MGGLTDHVPEADAIVSRRQRRGVRAGVAARNASSAATSLLDGRPAADCGPVPVRNYLGATCQMGDLDLRAVTW